jgi:hypothetical protein
MSGSQGERPTFPEDHPCESLRGYPVPERARMRRLIAERCAWLEKRIGENARSGSGTGHHVLELAALVELEAQWSEARQRARSAVEHLQRAIASAAEAGEISVDGAARLAELVGRLVAMPTP